MRLVVIFLSFVLEKKGRAQQAGSLDIILADTLSPKYDTTTIMDTYPDQRSFSKTHMGYGQFLDTDRVFIILLLVFKSGTYILFGKFEPYTKIPIPS